jgi:hypothetical protein
MAPAKKLMPLGEALRQRDARLRSAWEHGYGAALEDARAGKVARLLDLLRAHTTPSEADFDRLADYVADYIEATAKLGHRQRDAVVHRAANLAEAILTIAPRRNGRVSDEYRTRAIALACERVQLEFDSAADPDDLAEQVRDLLRRPSSRRR